MRPKAKALGYPDCDELMRVCSEALGYPIRSRSQFREGVEGFLRRGTLGGSEDGGHGVDVRDAVDLVACEVEDRHGSEGVHRVAVARGEVEYGVASGRALDAGFAACEQQRCGEAFEVQLEGAADGLVEVIDVECEVARWIGEEGVGTCGKGAEVEDVGVAAELGEDAGVGMAGEVGGHDGHGAAEEAEGTGCHTLVLDGEQCGDAAALRLAEERERVMAAGGGGEFRVGGARNVLAGGEATGLEQG